MTPAPTCTGGHLARDPNRKHRLVDLPCGCQDVHYADGTVCFEHAHTECREAGAALALIQLAADEDSARVTR